MNNKFHKGTISPPPRLTVHDSGAVNIQTLHTGHLSSLESIMNMHRKSATMLGSVMTMILALTHPALGGK
jgi:hypothetical protein